MCCFEEFLDYIRYNDENNFKENITKLKNINQENENGFTPLGIALWHNNIEFAKLLIEYGANFKNPSIQLAAARHLRTIHFLENKNELRVNCQKSDGCFTLLQQAANIVEGTMFKSFRNYELIEERLKVMKYLLKKGAKVDAQNKYGRTVLMSVVEYDNIEMLNLFISYNVDISIKDNNGDTVMDYAKSDEIKDILLRYNKLKNF